MDLGVRQAVLVAFTDEGRFTVAGYGASEQEHEALRPLCAAIEQGILNGTLPAPEV